MKTIIFEIPIVPKAQKRDRVASRGGHGISYKDKVQRQYEGKIAALLAQHCPEKPYEGPLKLQVTAFLPIPKSKPKKFKEAALAGTIRPTGKPDSSNLAKNVEDIMNGVMYRDDAQIVDLISSKHYSDNPRWEIILTIYEG